MSCLKLLFAELRAVVFRGCGVRVCLSDDKSLPVCRYASSVWMRPNLGARLFNAMEAYGFNNIIT